MMGLAEFDHHTFYLPALGPASVVFDLGAAGGAFGANLHAMTGCRSICAEASPSVFRNLQAARGVEAHQLAVGGTDGPVSMTVGGHVGDTYWVRGVDDDGEDAGTETIEVPGVTLATLMARTGVDFVDLIKLDIEGAEFAFFDAAGDDTLRRVGQMTVEFHDFLDPARRPDVLAIIRRLEGLGFATVIMTRNTLGDVLFLNRAHLPVDAVQLFVMRTVVKYGRGIRRILARRFAPRRSDMAA